MWVCMYLYVCHFHFKCKRRVKQKYYAYRYKLMMVTLCPCSYILLYIFVCLTSLQVLKLGGVFSAFFRSRSFWWTIHLYILGNMMVMYLDKSPICLTSIYTYCRNKKRNVIFHFSIFIYSSTCIVYRCIINNILSPVFQSKPMYILR